jgi:toxin ParE1/3/4
VILIIDERATAELDEAMAWYESQRGGMGLELRAEFSRACDVLRSNPDGGTTVVGTRFRFLRLRPFQYAMCFREVPDGIWIAAVAHDRRKSRYWLRRRPKRRS